MTAPLLLAIAVAFAPAPPAAPPQRVPAETAPADDPALRRFFGELTGILGDALERADKTSSLPDKTWNPFEETKASNEARINALLDECAALLAEGSATDVRQRLRALEAERKELEETIRDGFEKQAAATPRSEKDWYDLFGKSKEDYEASIRDARARQAGIDREIASLHAEFATQLRKLGLELGTDGADALLASVSGDKFVDMAVAFDNIRLVTDQLRKIAERMQESTETAKRYYGMYVLLVRLMDRIQDAFVGHIQQFALPKVKSYGDEAAATEAQAKKLLRKAAESDRPVLEKNIAACKLAQEAAANYAAYLTAQSDRVRELNKVVEERLKVAENTYRTMSVSVGLAELIKKGELDLQAVLSMELPPLKGFDNVALREQYARLNARLRRE